MVAKRLSIGISHPTPVLQSIESPSYEEVLEMLNYAQVLQAKFGDEIVVKDFVNV